MCPDLPDLQNVAKRFLLLFGLFLLQLLLVVLAMDTCLHAFAVHVESYCHHCGMLP